MKLSDIKARRDYIDNNGARVRVTGFDVWGGAVWCRIRLPGRRVSTLIAHPDSIVRLVD